jgi:fumarylacetoacetase
MIDETHDPALRSWVESANKENTDFPIQNLPLAAYLHGREQRPRIGVAIGNAIFDISQWLPHENLNGYFALTAAERRDLRREWSRALREGAPRESLVPQTECQMLLPAIIPDYTDFYASIHHATNVGKMFRPDNPLLPNYRHVPVAYHGRASSIVVSGTPIKRPAGQLGENIFGLSQELDYEVELGAFVGPGNAMGRPISIDEARDHVAGFCLLNDWSARDIQRWEYQPLGPFLAKNFATSISPWVITLDALEPFRVPAPPHDTPSGERRRSNPSWLLRPPRISADRLRSLQGHNRALDGRILLNKDVNWGYCFSNTPMLSSFRPFGSWPFSCAVSVFPSSETTTCTELTTFLPALPLH